MKTTFFETRAEWTDWLKINHDKASEIWLLAYKVKMGKKCVSYSEALEEALCFGWIDSRMRRIDDEKHAWRFAPRRANSIWSLKNRRLVERLIREGRMAKPGLEKVEAARRSGNWDRALAPSTPPRMPSTLKEALMKDEKAWKNFKALAKTYRTAYIYWVITAKKEETRQKRIREVVKRAKSNIRSIVG